MAKLIASLVTYRSPLSVLAHTLRAFAEASARAVAEGEVEEVKLVVLDNASGAKYRAQLRALIAQ